MLSFISILEGSFGEVMGHGELFRGPLSQERVALGMLSRVSAPSARKKGDSIMERKGTKVYMGVLGNIDLCHIHV